MRPFGIAIDPRFKLHDTGPGHPERPARLDAVRAGLEAEGVLATAQQVAVAPISRQLLERVHTREYLERLETACRDGDPFIDTADSAICRASWDVALLAAGAVVGAARQIAGGELRRAFCAVRPPGHHAEADRSMGFCLFANVVLGARVFLDEFAMERVAIVDWDVHHGNGTQHLFEVDPRVLFVSLHGHPEHLYPGTGYSHEAGRGAGTQFTINIPFPPGATDSDYRAAFDQTVVPALERFRPQAMLISAGFDAHRDDPVGNLSLTDDAFAWMTRVLLQLASQHCDRRLLSVLEGGYNLDVLRRCAGEHARLLADD